MKLTSIQFGRGEFSKDQAVERVMGILDQTPPGDLVLLPEMWPSGFFRFDHYESDAESIDGPLVTAFRQKAVDLGIHVLMGSFVERRSDRLYNTSLLIDPGGAIIAEYRKIHLFGYQSSERDLLTRGETVTVAETPWGKAGLATCYDLRFPGQFRRMIDMGADFFLVVSAWPAVRRDAWVLFNRARALENLAYLISCNCAGSDDGSAYAGHSMVVDPLGTVIADGGESAGVVSAEIDMGRVAAVRQEFSALHDRVALT